MTHSHDPLQDAVTSLMGHALAELEDMCRIPSVSFPGYDPMHVRQSAEVVARLLRKTGFPEVKVVEDGCAPAVLAAWGHDPAQPTVLLYAHHDVQPEMREHLWISKPYVPTVRDGRLFARGAADDKAGIIVHAAAAQALHFLGTGMPNLRVVIEGEEEVGSPGLHHLLSTQREFLQCDVAIVADLGNFATGVPALTASLRGMVALEVEVRAMDRSVHSGLWSGPVPDPAQGLCRMLAALLDDAGQIAVPGLLDSVVPPDAQTLASFHSLGIGADSFCAEAALRPGVRLLCPAHEIPQTLWRRPSITVTTLEAGNRKSAGNVLLDSAWARVSVRLVPGMEWHKVVEQVSAFLRAKCPWGLELSIAHDEGANAWVTPTDHPAFQAMGAALQHGYGTPARIMGCGASIPGAPMFSQVFGDIPVLLTGLEDSQANAHGENESLDLGDLRKAILAQADFLRRVAQGALA